MPVENPKIFFSYSRADVKFVLRLAKDLRSVGTNLWLDQLDIPPGDRWDRSVEAALKASPCLLVILSPTSVASNNVMDEVSFALGENKKVLPILYQNCEIPFRLRRLQYIDFTFNYDTGLAELLKTLGVQLGQTPLPSEQPTIRPVSEVKPEEKGTLAKSPISPSSPPGSDMKVVPKIWILGAIVVVTIVVFGAYWLSNARQGGTSYPPLVSHGTTPAFFSCTSQAQCSAGTACVDNGGDRRYYCKPYCTEDLECKKFPYPGLKCLPVRGSPSQRICNDAESSFIPEHQ